MTFGATMLYAPGMRVLSLLVLLVVGFGFGVAPMPANAQPCPLHTGEAATMVDSPRAVGDASTFTPAGNESIVTVVAFGASGSSAPDTDPDHAVPEEELCCHVAAAVTAALGPTVGPHHGTVGRAFLPWGLPPWAAPLTDIYRPPAFV